MTIARVRQAEAWPEAGPFNLRVIPDVNEGGVIISADGSAEICIAGPPEKSNPGTWVVPIKFATIERAQLARERLATAFAAIKDIQSKPVPEACAEHRPCVTFLSRELVKHRICEVCGEHLGTLKLNAEREWVEL